MIVSAFEFALTKKSLIPTWKKIAVFRFVQVTLIQISVYGLLQLRRANKS